MNAVSYYMHSTHMRSSKWKMILGIFFNKNGSFRNIRQMNANYACITFLRGWKEMLFFWFIINQVRDVKFYKYIDMHINKYILCNMYLPTWHEANDCKWNKCYPTKTTHSESWKKSLVFIKISLYIWNVREILPQTLAYMWK